MTKLKIFLKQKKMLWLLILKKDTIIYADEISYLKNNEEIFTKGKTKALIENKYEFNSENVSYYRNLGAFNFSKKIFCGR
jgi:hypothetical protein